MSGSVHSVPGSGRRSGCLSTMGGLAGIVVLAPVALAVRTARALRRGSETRFRRGSSPFDGGLTRIDLEIDVVGAAIDAARRNLTDAVVRIAEVLQRPDDVYHLVFREGALDETTVLPVGPLLQELGERFHLAMSQTALAGRTAVWLTLGRDRRVIELLDPLSYDPETEGEPEALLARSGLRWGMASAFARSGPSTVFRVALFVPEDSVPRIDPLISRLIS